MIKKNVVDEIEDVFIKELGSGSSFILKQNLRDLGLTRETFRKSDIKNLISHLIKEYNKVLGNHVYVLKVEIEKRFFKKVPN